MTAQKTDALVFDLGKVLIDFSVERACDQISIVSGVTPSAIKRFLFDDGLELEFERGGIDFTSLHQKFERHFNVSVLRQTLEHAAADVFTPMEDSLDLLKTLRHKYKGKAPFVLLSNTNEIHWNHIESNWRISELFDHVVLSFKVKDLKPGEKIYREAIKCAGFPAERCFFVDDVPANIEGARRVGLDCALFQGVSLLTKHLAERGFRV